MRPQVPRPRQQPIKQLMPEKLHNVFQVRMYRLNDANESVSTLFDSQMYSTNKDYSDPKNPYLLSCVYIGEQWRFRLSLTNVSPYTIRNFALSAHVEMLNTKGSQQIYPNAQQTCPNLIPLNGSLDIDLEYNISANNNSTNMSLSNNTTTYQVILTLNAGNEDENRLYKEYFQVQALPAIQFSYTKQTLSDKLFVECSLVNVTLLGNASMTLNCSVHFKCMGLFEAYKLMFEEDEKNNNDNTNTNSNPAMQKIVLKPQETKTVLFQIEMKNPSSLVNLNALSVGQIEIRWQNDSRKGVFLSDIVQRRSLFCKKLDQVHTNIEVLVVHCPNQSIVYEPFIVTLHIFNQERYPYRLWLSLDKNLSGYLLAVNCSKQYLGVVKAHSSVKTDFTLMAFSPGIQTLTGIVIEAQKCASNYVSDWSGRSVASNAPSAVSSSSITSASVNTMAVGGNINALTAINTLAQSKSNPTTTTSGSYFLNNLQTVKGLRGVSDTLKSMATFQAYTNKKDWIQPSDGTGPGTITIHYESKQNVFVDVPKHYKPSITSPPIKIDQLKQPQKETSNILSNLSESKSQGLESIDLGSTTLEKKQEQLLTEVIEEPSEIKKDIEKQEPEMGLELGYNVESKEMETKSVIEENLPFDSVPSILDNRDEAIYDTTNTDWMSREEKFESPTVFEEKKEENEMEEENIPIGEEIGDTEENIDQEMNEAAKFITKLTHNASNSAEVDLDTTNANILTRETQTNDENRIEIVEPPLNEDTFAQDNPAEQIMTDNIEQPSHGNVHSQISDYSDES